MKKLLLLLACLCPAGAEPKTPPQLPVIEINSSPSLSPAAPPAANSTIELKPIEGQKPEKLQGQGRAYWGSPYGVPAGPGRGWPDAGPPGASGPAGGLLTPGGFPGRTY
jgi:hypothetical protein